MKQITSVLVKAVVGGNRIAERSMPLKEAVISFGEGQDIWDRVAAGTQIAPLIRRVEVRGVVSIFFTYEPVLADLQSGPSDEQCDANGRA